VDLGPRKSVKRHFCPRKGVHRVAWRRALPRDSPYCRLILLMRDSPYGAQRQGTDGSCRFFSAIELQFFANPL
jgi:hypothetical protein